ncbi:MAG TPA: DUF3352 domain-containing protein [bacterium]|nr:DUF3352 domain-containing protein [bacterium]
MNCPKCGAVLEPSKAFCTKCGQRIFMSDGIRPPQANPRPEAALQTSSIGTTPAPAAKPTRVPVREPRTGKSPLGLVLIVMGLLLFGLVGAWGLLGRLPLLGDFPFPNLISGLSIKRIDEVIDLVPADADMVMIAAADPEATQLTQLQNLWSLFPASSRFTLSLSAWLDADCDAADTASVCWQNDIQPWIGAEFGLMYTLPEGETPANLGIIIQSKNMDQTKTFIDKLVTLEQAKATTDRYRDIEILVVEARVGGQPLPADPNSLAAAPAEGDASPIHTGYIAYAGKFFIVANDRNFLQACLDIYADPKSSPAFTATTGYKEIKQELPADRLARLFISPAAAEAITQSTGILPVLSFDPVTLLTGTQSESASRLYSLIGFALTSAADGLSLRGYSSYQPNLGAGFRNGASSFNPEMVSRAPATAAAYFEGGNLKTTISYALENQMYLDPEITAQLDALKAGLSAAPYLLSWDDTLMSWLNAPYAIVLLPGSEYPSLNLLLKVENMEQAQNSLNQIMQAGETALLARLALNPAYDLTQTGSLLSKQNLNGVEATVLSAPNFPAYLQLAYAQVGDLIIITTDADAINSFLAVEQGTEKSLLAQPDFSALYRSIPEDITGLVYLNREETMDILSSGYTILPLATDTTAAFDLPALETELAPCKALLGTTSREAGVEISQLHALIRE